ncbi:MAG: NADH-quinone oxidoreductase subunit NuoG [Bryobacteraceae bacterium]
MATIYIDNAPHPANPKENLLHTCLTLGFDLPYFCWHPAMGSVGACRQCAVKQFKDERDTHGKIVMACMTPASEGARISIRDPEAVEFRAAVVEGLMLHHPHDCPVCDEGGHCHLQDMTVMTGHDYRRYTYHKRTYRNQNLGPLVNHEMNRCIQCYRCVRFYRDYAGGHDLNVFHLRNTTYFGRHADGVLENEFSGNLVEVCPTGVFTDKTYAAHYTRKWDLQFAPSVCVHCGLGCNISPGERYGILRAIFSRFNREVNGYFLCDRGRFGYGFVNSPARIRRPLLRREPVSKAVAVEYAASLFFGGKVIGIGSPRASLEANFALRELVGPDRFFGGDGLISKILEILRSSPAQLPSLYDVELSDAVLVLGEDLTNVAPRMALSVRQSVRQQPLQIAEKLRIPLWLDQSVREAVHGELGPLFIASTSATALDDIATLTYRAAPDDLARLGFAVAHALDSGSPAVSGPVPGSVDRIVSALQAAQRPLVICGPSCGSEPLINAAANIARSLCRNGRVAGLSYVVPECNSLGLALLGGRPLEEALPEIHNGASVIALENDIYRRLPAFRPATTLIALDHLNNRTTADADLTLPAATFAEGDGTLISNEGRAQRFFQVFVPGDDIQESWRWLRDILVASGRRESGLWPNLDSIISAMCAAVPALADVREAAPSAAFRIAGQKVPREPRRFSGRTSMFANIDVHEPEPPADPDAPLAFSMEGAPVQPPSSLIPFFWSPGWNSPQSVGKFQSEVGDGLRGGDPGVRLIEPSRDVPGAWFENIPAAFEPRVGEWLFVPLFHLFGSEELSVHSPAIAELAVKPYVAINPEDATLLRVSAADRAAITAQGVTHELPIQIRPDLPRGVTGLPPLEGIGLPAWGKIRRIS